MGANISRLSDLLGRISGIWEAWSKHVIWRRHYCWGPQHAGLRLWASLL